MSDETLNQRKPLGVLRASAVQPVVLILIAAAALRLAYILLFGQTLSLQASGYDAYAANLLAGRGYTHFPDLQPDSDLPPLYSFFLVGVYTLLVRSAVAVAWVQVVFDLVTIAAIYAIGCRVGGKRVGLLAAAFTAFYPYLLFQDLTVNDTALFIMLLTVGIWGVYRAQKASENPTPDPSPYTERGEKQSADAFSMPHAFRSAVFVGLIFGQAALTKTLVVLLLPLIALWWWRQSGFKRAVASSAVMAVVFAAVIIPWVIRNTRVQGTFTLISTNDGSNLYQGNNPCVADNLLAGWDAQWAPCLNPAPAGLSETELSTWSRNQALDYLRTHVGDWPHLFAAKFITLWSPELLPRGVPPNANLSNDAVLQYQQPLFQAARLVHLLYFTPLLILGLIGLWRAGRQRQLTGQYAPLVMVLVVITIAYLVYHPSTRYRSPADPFLFVLSACALVWLWDRWKLRRDPKSLPSAK